jgi:hypothetical protein
VTETRAESFDSMRRGAKAPLFCDLYAELFRDPIVKLLERPEVIDRMKATEYGSRICNGLRQYN